MKIALIGYGKMGKTIDSLAGPHEVVARVDQHNLNELRPEFLQQADVAIEFTSPASAFENVRKCLQAGVPVVSGTTGWQDQLEEAIQLTKKREGAFFYATNFSIGVNILFAISRQLASLMNRYPEYQLSIEEIHHTEKLDAPSGTAITLAAELLDVLKYKSKWVHEKEPGEDELLITSKRITDTPGTHTVSYLSEIDQIELKHTAYSREGFAKGALKAAEWLVGKRGYFGMRDMLGF